MPGQTVFPTVTRVVAEMRTGGKPGADVLAARVTARAAHEDVCAAIDHPYSLKDVTKPFFGTLINVTVRSACILDKQYQSPAHSDVRWRLGRQSVTTD
jgi:hypothetical protein